MNKTLESMGQKAKAAARLLRKIKTSDKNEALLAMAEALLDNQAIIMDANLIDINQAIEAGLTQPMIERLTLSEERIQAMADSIKQIASLPDPIGYIEEMKVGADGIQIGKRRVPLGVVGIIYESRPNVTADAAALCFKSGNAVILRGGKEALASNQAILKALRHGLEKAELPITSIQLITDPSRQIASDFMKMNTYLDCLIPRGGAGLIQHVLKTATVPVIETGVGNCHLYVDKDADLQMATRILINAKCDRPSVCNAIETLLVHQDLAETFMPVFSDALRPYQVDIRGDKETLSLMPGSQPVTEEDYHTEFLSMKLAVKVVKNYEEAVTHIQEYSTGHSEIIITDSYQTSQDFLDDIDSAAVYVNSSSRFTDGGCFGLGGEIGVSTQKLHARGPMGLEALTSYKYIILGQGQIRGTTGNEFTS